MSLRSIRLSKTIARIEAVETMAHEFMSPTAEPLLIQQVDHIILWYYTGLTCTVGIYTGRIYNSVPHIFRSAVCVDIYSLSVIGPRMYDERIHTHFLWFPVICQFQFLHSFNYSAGNRQ